MYQKQEIIFKKNTELLKKHEEFIKKSCEIGYTEACEFFKYENSLADLELVEKTYAAEEFLSVEVEYYVNLLNLLSQFSYKQTYWNNSSEKHVYINFNVEKNETDDEICVVIEEFLDNDFALNGLEVPKIVEFLYNATKKLEYLQEQYAENHEKFGDCLRYSCISRYFDEISNGEGAIGIFNHEMNKFEIYGYGVACNGWSGEIMTDHIVDKSVLEQQPDKLWYATNPMIFWLPMGSIEENDDPDAEYLDDLNNLWEIIKDQYGINSYGGGAKEYEGGIENEDEFVIYFLKDYEDNENTPLTSKEILELLNKIEAANHVFLEMQKKTCERNGLNYADYANDGFGSNLLFYSDENEILYAEAGSSVENGVRTGNIVLHCKKF